MTGDDAGQQSGEWTLTSEVVAVLPEPGDAETGPDGLPLVEVTLLGAPVLVWERSTRHTAELVRELSLLALGQRGAAPGRPVDPRLLELSDALTSRFAGISDEQGAVLDDALAEGRRSEDVSYRVPVSSRQACLTLAGLLDEADRFCEREQLLTEPSPPDQRAFRQWYLHEFVRQIDGRPPQPWTGPRD